MRAISINIDFSAFLNARDWYLTSQCPWRLDVLLSGASARPCQNSRSPMNTKPFKSIANTRLSFLRTCCRHSDAALKRCTDPRQPGSLPFLLLSHGNRTESINKSHKGSLMRLIGLLPRQQSNKKGPRSRASGELGSCRRQVLVCIPWIRKSK